MQDAGSTRKTSAPHDRGGATGAPATQAQEVPLGPQPLAEASHMTNETSVCGRRGHTL